MHSPSLRHAAISDATALGTIQVTSWRSAFRGIAPDDYLDHQVSPESQAEDWKEILADGEQIVIVAEIKNEVVGYAWAHREDNPAIEWDAELISMHILPEFKRRGIGRGLVSAIAAELRNRDCSSFHLSVLEENHPARAFYESIGGTLVGRQKTQLGGKDVTDVFYAWRNLSNLEEHSMRTNPFNDPLCS